MVDSRALEESAPAVGRAAPDFDAADLEGASLSLREYRGRVVLLHFWVSGDARGLPELRRVHALLHESGFDVIGISVDQRLEDLQGFLAKEPAVPWRPDAWKGALPRLYQVTSFPRSILVGKDGAIRALRVDPSSMQGEVERALAE